MGNYEMLIWVAYGITGLVMFWLLWRTIKELHDAEAALGNLQEIPGSTFASTRYVAPKISTPADQNA